MTKLLFKLFKYSFNKSGYSKLEIIFLNYYWILVVGGIVYITSGIGWFNSIIPLFIYALLFTERSKVKFNFFDLLWIISFLWAIMTWLTNSYSNKYILIFYCFLEQMAYFMCYWLVRRNKKLNAQEIIKSSFFPLILTSILGIYLYFFPPSWYLNMTRSFSTQFEQFEFLRLRSIFFSSYTISYFLGFAMIYMFYTLVTGTDKHRKYTYIILGIFSITLLLTIQRSVIGAVAISFLIYIIYSLKYNKISNAKSLIVIAGIALMFGITIINKMDDSSKDFYLNKITSITDNSSETVGKRLFLNKGMSKYEIWGDGVGRHALAADKYVEGSALRDGEYNKLLLEQGYIGFTIFSILILAAIFKCLIYFKYLSFEFSILIFLLICMIGANPISTVDKHPIIYWIVIGQISNFEQKYAVNSHRHI